MSAKIVEASSSEGSALEKPWFVARLSGTENIYKICAESFKSRKHLHAIVREAQEMISSALGSPESHPQTGVGQ